MNSKIKVPIIGITSSMEYDDKRRKYPTAFAFDWLKTKESLKVFLAYGAFAAIAAFSDVIEETILKAIPTSSGMFLLSYALYIFLAIFFVFISFYFVGMAVVFALQRRKRKPRGFGFGEYIEIIKIAIISFLRSLFWCHSAKLRKAQWACVAALVLSGALSIFAVAANAMPLLIAGLLILMLAFFAYAVVVIYAGIRYGFSIVVFFDKRLDVKKSVRESWEITRGNVLQLIFASLLAGIVSTIAFGIAALFVSILLATLGVAFSAAASIAIFTVAFNLFFSWFLFMPQNFIEVALYDNILSGGARQKR